MKWIESLRDLQPLNDLPVDEAVRRQRALTLGVTLINVGFYFGSVLNLEIGLRWQYWLVALQINWLGFGLALSGRYRLGTAVQFVTLTIDAVWSSPGVPNHLWLQFFVTGLLTLHPPTRDDAPFGLASLKWLFLIIFFWSGIQKALHGAWLNGAFLAWSAGKLGKMQWMLAPLMSGEELERLSQLATDGRPRGPFLPEAPLIVLLSVVIVVAEIVLPILILVPRVRRIAAWASITIFAGIILASREVIFGSLMLGILTLFLPERLTRIHPWAVGLLLLVYSIARTFFPGWHLN